MPAPEKWSKIMPVVLLAKRPCWWRSFWGHADSGHRRNECCWSACQRVCFCEASTYFFLMRLRCCVTHWSDSICWRPRFLKAAASVRPVGLCWGRPRRLKRMSRSQSCGCLMARMTTFLFVFKVCVTPFHFQSRQLCIDQVTSLLAVFCLTGILITINLRVFIIKKLD